MALYKTPNENGTPLSTSSDDKKKPVQLQTISTSYQSPSRESTGRVQMLNNDILVNNSVDNKVCVGYNPGLDDWGLFVSKPGINVMTNTDPANLIFNSSQNSFKIVLEGSSVTGEYTVSGGTSGVWTNFLGSPLTIPHNLGFVPGIIAYVKAVGTSNQYILLPSTFQSIVGTGGSGAQFNRIAINVDDNNIYVLDTTLVNGIVTTPYTAGGLNVKYYLTQETAN